jgi:hypothetical protein
MHHAPALGFKDEAVRWMLSAYRAVDTTATVTANVIKEFIGDRELLASMRRDLGNPDRARAAGWMRCGGGHFNPVVLRSAGAAAQVADSRSSLARKHMRRRWRPWDPSAFPDPKLMRPDRPEKSYMHFGHGLHECSGRRSTRCRFRRSWALSGRSLRVRRHSLRRAVSG